MDVLASVLDGLAVGAGLFWRAFWALAIGYAASAVIQVLVSRREIAKHLGQGEPKQLGLGMLFGVLSSSCSFAALSATRSLFQKGAHLTAALAFMFASTNLAVEVAALTFIFLGWQFVLGHVLGAFLLVATMALLVRVTWREGMIEDARRRAATATGAGEDPAENLPAALTDRVRSGEAWRRIGQRFIEEWRMVWKDLVAGFTVAGLVAALVPREWFQALFPRELPPVVMVLVHTVLAPVAAIFTVVGSMGNGPLAAILWQNGVAFGGILAFLASDFIVPPSLRINARYYGWRFAVYLGVIFAVAAIVTGIVLHALFAAIGLIPEEKGSVRELARFAIDHTFWLNLVAIAATGTLVWLGRRGRGRGASRRDAGRGGESDR